MRIEVVTVGAVASEAGANGRPYQTVEVSYKNETGQVQGKKLVSFNAPEVFERVSAAKPGDVFDVTVVKNGKYWNWTDIARNDGSAPPTPAVAPQRTYQKGGFAAKTVEPGRFESAEERAAKQEKISRQAVLNTAVAILTATGEGFDSKAVIKVAKELKQYVDESVSNKKAAQAAPDTDIPF